MFLNLFVYISSILCAQLFMVCLYQKIIQFNLRKKKKLNKFNFSVVPKSYVSKKKIQIRNIIQIVSIDTERCLNIYYVPAYNVLHVYFDLGFTLSSVC